MKILLVLLLAIGLAGCLVKDKIKTKIEGVPNLNEEISLTIPAEELTDEAREIENPFIALISKNSGNIAGYYRVRGRIQFFGPKWKKRTFTVTCNGSDCVVGKDKLEGYRPSYIIFNTIDDCRFIWGGDYIISETEVVIRNQPVLGACKP